MNIEKEYEKYLAVQREANEALQDYQNASKVHQIISMFRSDEEAEIAWEVAVSRINKYRRLNHRCAELWQPEFLELTGDRLRAEGKL